MRKIITILAVAIAAICLTMGGATAGRLITGHDIKDNTIRSGDIKNDSLRSRDILNGSLDLSDLNRRTLNYIQFGQGSPGEPGNDGARGPQGPQGPSGIVGAYYAVAEYNAGDTNAGAIATVACKSPGDSAIAGGVQILGLGVGSQQRNTPVSSSFPGRMDWSTNEPRPNRLDGWIVQFGGGSIAPEHVKVWALCLPVIVPVEQTYTQVD